jgi:hypothetical protein
MKNQSGNNGNRLYMSALFTLALAGCNSADYASRPEAAMDRINSNPVGPDKVNCLLPGQVRQLGRNFTYLTPRRNSQLTASECELRGGRLALNR